MPKNKPLPPFEEVDRLLRYDPETGNFFWRVTRCGRGQVGNRAGTVNGRGYATIMVDSRSYLAHRLAWLLAFGKEPENQIDHINGDTLDNRLINLRLATSVENGRNSKKPSNNTSGFKGVSRDRGRWAAKIRHHGRLIYLGSFATPQEADAAYREAAGKYFGEFVRAS